MFKALAASLLLLFVQHGVAITDPTQPGHYQPATQKKQSFRLSSILVGPQRRVAVINGKAVSEGDRVGRAMVKKIEKERVLLVSGGKHIQLVPQRATVRRED